MTSNKYAYRFLLIHRVLLDELLPIHIALRTPSQSLTELEQITARLSINLEIRANGSNNHDSESERHTLPSQQEDIIWKGKLVAAEQPVIVHPREDATEREDSYMVAVWECKALLSQ